MRSIAAPLALVILPTLASDVGATMLSEPVVNLTIDSSPPKADRHIDITADEGSWVYPMTRVEVLLDQQPQLRDALLTACPFLDEVDEYTLSSLDENLPPGPNVIIPEDQLVPLAGGPLAGPMNDELVRVLYQPILLATTNGVNTRRWSAAPDIWISPASIPGHLATELGEASAAAWSPLLDARGPNGTGPVETFFDLDLVTQATIHEQAIADGADPDDFFNSGPGAGSQWGDRTWFAIMSTNGGLELRVQALALRSATLAAPGEGESPNPITEDEETTTGLKDVGASPPIFPVPAVSHVATFTFGAHTGPPEKPDVTSLSPIVSTDGLGYVEGTQMFGHPILVISSTSPPGMHVRTLTWEAPGLWSFSGAGLPAGAATYVSIKNEPNHPSVGLSSHPDASFTVTSP